MKVLSIAKNNVDYLWATTFKNVVIEAVLENEHISFLEYFNNHVNTLSEELVQSLFPKELNPEIPMRDCPFLIQQNSSFYAILHRKEPLYKERFAEILQEIEKPKIEVIPDDPKTAKFKRTK